MDWERDLPSWPLNEHSQRVDCPPHVWHVLEAGSGPTILLLHGAGASTHSWSNLIPRLAEDFHVVAIDLPGHCFTKAGTRWRSGLTHMTEDIWALCQLLDWQPSIILGHSAGAAIALSLAEIMQAEGALPKIVGINPALSEFEGVAGWLFPLIAKSLALSPFTANLFTISGNSHQKARRIIESTGSKLDDGGLSYYAKLMSSRNHVDGALTMMAQWDVTPLAKRLSEIAAPCLFITGGLDQAVQPKVAESAAQRLQDCALHNFPTLGHLAHEQAPDLLLDLVLEWLQASAAH